MKYDTQQWSNISLLFHLQESDSGNRESVELDSSFESETSDIEVCEITI